VARAISNLHIVIMAVDLIAYCYFESFPQTSKVIYVFQIQVQSKNYIAKYNANTKTEHRLKIEISSTVMSRSPCGDVITPDITLNL